MDGKKTPLSLNQRNNRMINDISSTHPRKPHPSAIAVDEVKPSEMKLGGGRRLVKAFSKVDDCVDEADDVPQFSGLDDFVSDPKQESEIPVKVKLEGRRRLCKMSSEVGDDNSDSMKKFWFNGPSFSILSDFDSPLSEKSPSASFKDVPAEKNMELDEPKFSILSDFDSPTPVKNQTIMKNNNSSGSEIRDILNELSSKFDFLSIDRNKIPKIVDSERVSVAVMDRSKAINHEKKAEFPEYESASSSFSSTLGESDFSTGVINPSTAIGCDEYVNDDDELSEFESSYVVSEAHKTSNVNNKLADNKTRGITVKSDFRGKAVMSYLVDDDDDDEGPLIPSWRMSYLCR